ncbi:hypothetical protein CTA2_11868 [Colletotrichum tanaceti]|uniref:Uncharacterized protein n=1 Tax=Colletotrichum tanaceti TaxID=1306861 RepID=A0A4U6X0B5_9PEZI|nr:hypothetical protein CTA2_11868 [Colletotrichum tanaceti]TKW48434.1 hypothetical protein CTA1_5480 [Colletotrichum tanaceti]
MAFDQQTRRPTNNAAYPSNSNYSPAGHPSSSISNAAYPSDSSYRPSDLTMPTDDKLAMPNARYSQSYNTDPGADNIGNSRQASYPSYLANVQPQQGWARSPAHDPLLSPYSPASGPITPWSPDGMSAANPNLPPPPPYVTSRSRSGTNTSIPGDPVSPHSSEHALLGAQQTHQQQNAPHPSRSRGDYMRTSQQSPVPAAAYVANAMSGQGKRGGPRAHLQSMTGGMPAYGNSSGQLGPVAQARRRRKVKLGILAGVLCAVLLLLVALVVGVLVGVVKVNNKDDKPPQQAPPRF